jgi:hypothetical protein
MNVTWVLKPGGGALTEDHLVAFFPHFCDESFSGVHNPSKSCLNVLDFSEGLEDMLSSKAEEAKTVTIKA